MIRTHVTTRATSWVCVGDPVTVSVLDAHGRSTGRLITLCDGDKLSVDGPCRVVSASDDGDLSGLVGEVTRVVEEEE